MSTSSHYMSFYSHYHEKNSSTTDKNVDETDSEFERYFEYEIERNVECNEITENRFKNLF
jgi:hypothetical protein